MWTLALAHCASACTGSPGVAVVVSKKVILSKLNMLCLGGKRLSRSGHSDREPSCRSHASGSDGGKELDQDSWTLGVVATRGAVGKMTKVATCFNL
jgi:hypothetical protein